MAVLLLALVTGFAAAQQNSGEPSSPPVAAAAAVATLATVAELTFAPELFHVGDRVVVSIVLDTGRGRVLTPPAALPAADWTVIHAVEVLPRSAGRWEVRVAFSSFQPGVLTLPPIDVGPFLLQNVRVQAASLLPTGGGAPLVLRPLRHQLALPGTTAGLLIAAITLLAVPHLVISGVLVLVRGARRWRVQRVRNLPRARLRQEVSRLHAGAAAPTALAFYVRLGQLLRTYLALRLQIPARAATTRELRAALPALGFPDRLGSELTAILDTADRVKFAGQPSDRAEMLALSERLVTLVDEIDSDLQRRERAAAEAAPAAPAAPAARAAPTEESADDPASTSAGASPRKTYRRAVGGAGVEL